VLQLLNNVVEQQFIFIDKFKKPTPAMELVFDYLKIVLVIFLLYFFNYYLVYTFYPLL